MKFSSFTYFLLLTGLLAVTLYGCASTGSPSGGPRDKTPPALLVEKSSPNFSTNYSPKKIELVFDEWIELKNQQKEVLISPPFFRNPKLSFRGKKVTVEFPEDEPLRPDATYTINFGKSIVDFTESNPAEGFRFIFATGDKIDSLSFSGNVVDAYGGEPVENVLVMVYDVLGDSVVLSEKPFYYARAADEGKFTFENVKNDTFKLVVIEDLNLNYLLDDEVERLAFLDSTFLLTDSSSIQLDLRLFLPEQRLRVLSSSSKVPGVITVIFNNPAEQVTYEYLYPDAFSPTIEASGDTARFYFSEPIDSVGVVFGSDTLDFVIKPFDSLFYTNKLTLQGDNRIDGKLAPFDSLRMLFSAPILSIDTALIALTDEPVEIEEKDTTIRNVDTSALLRVDSLAALDTLRMPMDSIKITTDFVEDTAVLDTIVSDSILLTDSILAGGDTIRSYSFMADAISRALQISNQWKSAHRYRLTLLPGAVTDIYGRTTDTVTFDFLTSSPDEYGAIDLTIAGIDSATQYIVLLRQGEKVVTKRIINSVSSQKLLYRRLPVNTYNIHLIKDDNRDGKWTTGDYWLQRQPELLKKFEIEKLREDWDLEATISWDELEVIMHTDSLGVSQDSLGGTPQDSIKTQDGRGSERGGKKNEKIKSGQQKTPRGREGELPDGRMR